MSAQVEEMHHWYECVEPALEQWVSILIACMNHLGSLKKLLIAKSHLVRL